MTKHELDLYLDKLPLFGEYIKTNKGTLLAKIFGVFTVHSEFMKEVHVMLMENTSQFDDPKNLISVFDLKGSLVDRKVKGKVKPSTILKD